MSALVQRVQAGLYRTPDGRYEIQYEEWWLDGECDCMICQNGYVNCPNDGYGRRDGWTIWDNVTANHVDEPFPYETYRQAKAALRDVLAAPPEAKEAT